MFSSRQSQQGLHDSSIAEISPRMRRIRVSSFAAQTMHDYSESSKPRGDSDWMWPRLAKAPDTSSKSSFSQVQPA